MIYKYLYLNLLYNFYASYIKILLILDVTIRNKSYNCNIIITYRIIISRILIVYQYL